MAALAFAGRAFDIVDRTGLWWGARRALIVADLHLEKSSWFAARGQMLPPYDSLATLERIAALVAQRDAREIWCLGDNFHDGEGPARLGGAAQTLLASLCAAHDWHWITGNHDAALPATIGGSVHDQAECDGLVLRHIADPSETAPELSGHYHPKIRVETRARGVSRPCFATRGNKLILPAFGALTGGLDARHPEISSALGGKGEALLAVRGQLLRFAL